MKNSKIRPEPLRYYEMTEPYLQISSERQFSQFEAGISHSTSRNVSRKRIRFVPEAPLWILLICLAWTGLLGCTPAVRFTNKDLSDLGSENRFKEVNSFLDSGPNDPSGNSVLQDSVNLSVYTLKSGDKIELISIQTQAFEEGPAALVMQYETEIKIDEIERLRKQADEVWSVFVEDVEAEGLSAAALRPTNSSGKVNDQIQRDSFGFVYIRQADGSWRSTSDD